MTGDLRPLSVQAMKRLFLLFSCLLLVCLFLACGGSPDRPRVLVLGLDGMDPQTIDLLMSEGKMPNFARLRQEGAYGRLVSQKPLLSPIIWTTIATGKGPEEHGIGHFVAISEETGEQLPVTSSMRKVKALWNIATEAGRTVATVGWWATWPPEQVDGHVVSDHTAYHFLFEGAFTGGEGDDSGDRTYPPDLFERLSPLLRRPEDLGADELSPFVEVPTEELEAPFDFQNELAHFCWALATAKSYRDVGLTLWREERPDLELVYIEGVDSSSHLFGHLFRAQDLGGELAKQQAKYGQTVEQMYLFADRLLGEYLDALDDRTTLVVLSDHGFELGALHDDPSKTRDLRRVSERFHKLEGILYLYGNQIKANTRIDRPSILDVTPTVLALLGAPVGDDMPGRILSESFREPVEVARIATWEGAGGSRNVEQAELGPAQRAQLQHLESLGYLGGSSGDDPSSAVSSPQGDRNMAAILFEQGDYRGAARLYLKLIELDPTDPTLRTSLAGCLGALGRFDEAMEELNRAIEIAPLSVEAYHNRAVIRERQGQVDLAVADYSTALRYQPQYEPSRRALLRLTGRQDVRGPRNAAEQEAARLAELASQAARRGQYEVALEHLEEAEKAAPKYVIIYQYRSNVAYLKGDLEGAILALEKGLEIEPDNALFRENLERLREQ